VRHLTLLAVSFFLRLGFSERWAPSLKDSREVRAAAAPVELQHFPLALHYLASYRPFVFEYGWTVALA
jgi:hypothetical protein